MTILLNSLIIVGYSQFSSKEDLTASVFGIASWYGENFRGKKTASGEIFNPDDLTCASNTYPFNTILKVYYFKNQRSIFCRVNDRGPSIRGRSLDLSKNAADILGLRKAGIGNVLITPTKNTHYE
jgi:rare lipoprotein A